MTRCLTAAQIDTLIDQAPIGALLAALGPYRSIDGGACPTCHADAWALDQLIWTCTGITAHRGTIHQLRIAVLADIDALTRLADADRITGPPLTQADGPTLPAVVDDWATPADLFRLHLTEGLSHDDQKAWCRLFAEAHGSAFLLQLLEPLEPPQLTTALLDVRTVLREHYADQEAAAA